MFNLIDDFTYIAFQHGMIYLRSQARLWYGALFVVLLVSILIALWRFACSPISKFYRCLFLCSTLLLPTVGVIAAINKFSKLTPIVREVSDEARQSSDLPDIFVIGSDALEASHLSVYGFERDTTPFLRSLAHEFLIFSNAFVGNPTSAGSLLSMLTGNETAATRVVHYPDIVRGEYSHRHFLAELRRLGYRMFESSMRHYADMFDLNVREGFHRANGRELDTFNLPFVSSYEETSRSLEFYFCLQMYDRLRNRIVSAFGIHDLNRWYDLVLRPHIYSGHDRRAFKEAEDFIKDNEASPVFVHLHLVGTHGPRYFVDEQVFSEGKTQDEDRMEDFYHDAILNFDRMLQDFVEHLVSINRYSNSMLLIYSDHDRYSTLNKRIPLMLRLPSMSSRGEVPFNAQLLDVAPTFLDVLGQEVPSWMMGKSLLSLSEIDRFRPIVSIAARNPSAAQYKKPPFGHFEKIGMAVCNWQYEMSLETGKIKRDVISDHTENCPVDAVPQVEEAKELLLQYLAKHRFDVSYLRD